MMPARLRHGGLCACLPVVIAAALRRNVDALNPVRHVIPSNTIHHLFLEEWNLPYSETRPQIFLRLHKAAEISRLIQRS